MLRGADRKSEAVGAAARPMVRSSTPFAIPVLGLLLATSAVRARAQDTTQAHAKDTTQAPATDTAEARPTSLPKGVDWTFNLDFGVGYFGFANSLYTNVRPDPSGDLGDNWAEGFVKPALSGTWRTGKSEVFGKLSVVGEGTISSPPPLVGDHATSFGFEDAYVGWRSGTRFGIGENAFQVTVGRAPYTVGHGMLVWDGAAEGGSYGGFWSNARKAWEFAAIGRFAPKHHTFDVFYLDRAELPENKTGTKLFGINYEFAPNATTTLGASYFRFAAKPDVLPERDGENVYDLRAFTAPLKALPDLAFELEYAHEDKSGVLSSTAWNAQAAYTLSKVPWKPTLSYRYAFFQGDDPSTPINEGFDALIPGFYDWGTWWQGEIAGEYFLSNSNLISHRFRVQVTPSESVTSSLIGYVFRLDQRASFLDTATSNDLATELDATTDWKASKNFTISFVAAVAHPQAAVQEKYDRTKNFVYGMIYVAYTY